jgi:hypothetical protein
MLFGFVPKFDIWLYPTAGRFVAVGTGVLEVMVGVTEVTVGVVVVAGVVVGVGVAVTVAVPGMQY